MATIDNGPAIEFSSQYVPLMQKFSSLLNPNGIENFHYIKVYYDGRYVYLNPDEEINRFYYEKVTRPSPILKGCIDNHCPEMFWPSHNLDFFFQWLLDHNFAHGYSIRHYSKEYYEVWAFSTTRDNSNIINIYPGLRNELYRFIKYFKHNTQEVIALADLCLGRYEHFEIKIEEGRNKPLSSLKIPWIYNNQEFKLSKRQEECIELLSKGLTAKGIGLHLKLNSRTVEEHINRAKEKFMVNYKSQLIEIYHDNVKGGI